MKFSDMPVASAKVLPRRRRERRDADPPKINEPPIGFPTLVSSVPGRGPFCSFDRPDTGIMIRLRAEVYKPCRVSLGRVSPGGQIPEIRK